TGYTGVRQFEWRVIVDRERRLAPEPEHKILLSILVPVLDEAENIAPLIEEISEVIVALQAPCEAIFVDDGSRDDSWDRLVALTATHAWLRGIRFLGNQGQTAAMAAGVAAARGELIAFVDADLQNDPHDLPNLIDPIISGPAA